MIIYIQRRWTFLCNQKYYTTCYYEKVVGRSRRLIQGELANYNFCKYVRHKILATNTVFFIATTLSSLLQSARVDHLAGFICSSASLVSNEWWLIMIEKQKVQQKLHAKTKWDHVRWYIHGKIKKVCFQMSFVNFS